MQAKLQLLSQYLLKENAVLFPQLREYSHFIQSINNLHLKLESHCQDLIESINENERKFEIQIENVMKTFDLMNKEIEQEIRKKTEDIKPQEEKINLDVQINKQNQKQAYKEIAKQGETEDIVSTVKLMFREKKFKKIMFCRLCVQQKQLSGLFFNPEDYLNHLQIQHEIVPTLKLVFQNVNKRFFSHILNDQEELKYLWNQNEMRLIVFLYFKNNNLIRNMYICGCILSQKEQLRKFFGNNLFFDQDSFKQHVLFQHKNQNQANSTHLIKIHKNNTILEIVDSKFDYLNQCISSRRNRKKIYDTILARQYYLTHARLLKINPNISILECLARCKPSVQRSIRPKLYQLSFSCPQCNFYTIGINYFRKHFLKNHSNSLRGQEIEKMIAKNELLLKECQFSISQYQNHTFKLVKPKNSYQNIDQEDLNNAKIQNLLIKTSVYKCGFCNGEDGFFQNPKDYLAHIHLQHQTYHPLNSHLFTIDNIEKYNQINEELGSEEQNDIK